MGTDQQLDDVIQTHVVVEQRLSIFHLLAPIKEPLLFRVYIEDLLYFQS